MTSTVAAALAAAVARLRAAGIESAAGDARVLIAHALGVDAAAVVGRPERALDAAAAVRFESLVARRARHEPVAYLSGRREFWSLDLAVTPATLIPRPDSETVVEAVLALLPNRDVPLSVLDLGTGSGCLLLALLSELPAARGLGVDVDPDALAVAAENAARLGLAGRAAFRRGDWGAGLDGAFDVVVSNPPYIRHGDIDGLDPDVALFEPRRALDGGADGLDAYRAIAADLPRMVAPGGIAALEVGADQAGAVTALLAGADFLDLGTRCDLAGRPRCVMLRRVKG
ncbi:MAG: peptide chain release factor N(5)-glutamine methyltransferase [Rhodospirillaceae bacterium]